jgi:hypothetical protein
LYVNLDIRKVIEIEEKKIFLIDDFINKNKENYKPEIFFLLDKLKK